MKERHVQWVERIANYTMFVVSAVLSISLFQQLSHEIIFKIIFIALAIVFEIVKLLMLIKFKTLLSKGIKMGNVIVYFIVYLAMALVSLTASAAFILVTSVQQSKIVAINSMGREAFISQIESIDTEINTLQTRLANLPIDHDTSTLRFSARIEVLQKQKNDIIKQINAISSNTSAQEIETDNAFDLLGRAVKMDGVTALTIFLIFLSLVLEVCIAITAEVVQDEGNSKATIEAYKESKYDLLAYSNVLLDVRLGNTRLNSDEVIATKLGFDVEKCKKYRNMLKGIQYKGAPILMSKKGSSYATVSKQNFLAIVAARADLSA